MRVSEVVTLLIQSKKLRGHRPNYVRELTRIGMRFSEHTNDPPLSAVSPSQLESFIFKTQSPGGQQTTRSRLSALFSFAIRSKIVSQNPLEEVAESLRSETTPPRILTPEQCRALLLHCLERPRTLAWFILGLFCGLRPSEAERTRWEDIRFQTGTLIVHGRNSKTRRHRIIELHPTANRWLSEAQSAGSELPIHPQPTRRAIRRLRPDLGLDSWPPDVLRHSCASYSLALSQDFTKTAWQLGNSEKVLLRHYYRLTDRETAEQFWNLTPENLDNRQLTFLL